MEWRTQSRRVTLTSCMDEMRHAHNLSHAMWCAMSEDYEQHELTRKLRASSLVSDVLSSCHHAYVIQVFLLDVIIQFYLLIVNSNCSHNIIACSTTRNRVI